MPNASTTRSLRPERPPPTSYFGITLGELLKGQIYLKARIDVDVTRIRPPYQSKPPTFPTEEEVEPLLPSPDHNPHKREEEDWTRNHIGHSVFSGWLRRCTRKTWESLRAMAFIEIGRASLVGVQCFGEGNRKLIRASSCSTAARSNATCFGECLISDGRRNDLGLSTESGISTKRDGLVRKAWGASIRRSPIERYLR